MVKNVLSPALTDFDSDNEFRRHDPAPFAGLQAHAAARYQRVVFDSPVGAQQYVGVGTAIVASMGYQEKMVVEHKHPTPAP
jgi:hypothetical protein